jgi:hypothetical protein
MAEPSQHTPAWGHRDLEGVIAGWRLDADALRRCGEPGKAAILDRCAKEATAGAEDWLTWLSETEALLRCKRSIDFLRARFPMWERQGHARLVRRGVRQYRRAVVPFREPA